jgi:hypothetical protein
VSEPAAWPWLALGVLGAYHGLNPAMGWLFAVARGLQERKLAAVLQALVPIAVGHELAVGVAVVLVGLAELAAAGALLRAAGALVLVGFGIFKLLRPRWHPRWVGMRVRQRDLVVWSFLMSSAHGAGLMLLPVLLGLPLPAQAEELASHARPAGLAGTTLLQDLAAVGVHTLAMLAVMAVVAVVVYTRLGVGVLRKAWINLDALWAAALVLAGVLTLFT